MAGADLSQHSLQGIRREPAVAKVEGTVRGDGGSQLKTCRAEIGGQGPATSKIGTTLRKGDQRPGR